MLSFFRKRGESKTSSQTELGSVTKKTKGGFTATFPDRNWGRFDWY